jgi:hypothetical protein
VPSRAAHDGLLDGGVGETLKQADYPEHLEGPERLAVPPPGSVLAETCQYYQYVS